VVIVRNEAVDPLQALLAQAFDDYQAGNDARAEAGYRQALARDANNRDALLGLAALAQRGNRAEEARLYFRHLLELNPLDSAPAAGLIALQGGVNPVNDESRIKLLLRQEPDAAYLHFALGTVYVGQGRWAEAQQAFFDAYRRDPANADHAFNLAVCLDHLGQPRAALEYYRRALDLARGRAAGFSAAQAEQRIETLTKAARGEAG
jgi:Tfp pilus assembly protein PilF